MAQSIYTGNVSSALGLDYTRNVPLSGGGAQDYINSVVADIYMSTNAHTNTYNVTVTLKNSSGGVLASSNRADIKFNADNYGGANWQFGFSTGFDVNAIASFDIIAAENGSKIFVKGWGKASPWHTRFTRFAALRPARICPRRSQRLTRCSTGQVRLRERRTASQGLSLNTLSRQTIAPGAIGLRLKQSAQVARAATPL